MTKRLLFTRRQSEGLADNADAERELRLMHRTFRRGELVPESVWCVANGMLTQRARRMSFDTKRPYVVCMREVLERDPHLRLGVGPYLRDREFNGIDFIEEDASHDNDQR